MNLSNKEKDVLIELLNMAIDIENNSEEIVKLIDRLKLPDKVGDSIKIELKQMRETLEEIRTYAREEGGFDVGYIENYFPRKVKNYKELN